MCPDHRFTSPHAPSGAAPASLTRRTVLARAVLLPLATTLSGALSACSREPSCNDTSGLSPDDVRTRTELAVYVERSPDPAKRCDRCVQFVAGAANACGTCKVVKGPIAPGGTCKLFAPKPA
jgi:hypothetical protein